MNRTVKKIALILVIIILLPGLFFTVYEINQIKESESVLEDIYNSQLDAILFSVNQYSQDLVSGWRNSINTILLNERSAQSRTAKIDSFLAINKTISSVFFADSLNSKKTLYIAAEGGYDSTGKNSFSELVIRHANKITRSYRYQTGGYIKTWPLPEETLDSSAVLLFLVDDPEHLRNICVVVFNPVMFVNDILAPKMQAISENRLIVTCTETNTDRVILQTGDPGDREVVQKKSLWLIPDYEIGILPVGGKIEDILAERTNTSIILIVILTAILVTGVIIVFRNIRREVELAQIKSDFVSNVSHELRTPLALISMFSETLEMGRTRTEEKKQEYYTIISKEANRLSRIVNKILSFSKIEAGKREYNFSSADINVIVEDIYNNYRFHLSNSGFSFCLSKDDQIPLIKADSEAISEAVINLIDNAVKYSREKKEINIKTGIEKNTVFIEVEDKGIGIPDEHQKRIFEKFYRVSEGLVHTTKGTGLGLTLVKHIMDAHKGEVKVRSKSGEGSSFILSFPIN